MKTSAVDEIPGVGPTRAKALITHFGSLAQVKDGVGGATGAGSRRRIRHGTSKFMPALHGADWHA